MCRSALMFCTGWFVLLAAAPAAPAYEVGDRVAVVTQTSTVGNDGKSERLPPGTVLVVDEVQGGRLRVETTFSGWIDAAAVQDLSHAVEYFTAAVKQKAEDPVALRALGNVRGALGELDLAMENLCRAVRLTPDDPLAHRWRAQVLMNAHLVDAARADVAATNRLLPNDPVALVLRAALERNLGRPAEALADYGAAIRLLPNYALPFRGYGDIRYCQKDFDAAVANYTNAIERDPSDFRAYVGRADSYLAKGLDDQALADYQAAVRVNPKYASAYYGLADFYLTSHNEKYRDAAQAVKMARTACELSQWQMAGAITTLSEAYRAAGDTSRAVELRIAALRTAMAETATVRNWQLESYFNRCRLCHQDEAHCKCEHPDLAPPSETKPPAPAGG